jgi:hypothetical protein
MKDMMGITLDPGQHVLYFRPGPGGMVHEDAKVVKTRQNSIRVEFLGTHDWGKKKGEQSNLFNTQGKVFVLNKNIELERIAFQEKIKDLERENEELRGEVEKIHYRYDILDL